MVIGILGSAIGLVASYHLNVASGATIILTLGAVFFTALALRRRAPALTSALAEPRAGAGFDLCHHGASRRIE